METITLKKCEDGIIWVTSDDNPIGIEYRPATDMETRHQMMFALSDFFKPELNKAPQKKKISVSFLVNLEEILRNSGAEWELVYLPEKDIYGFKLQDEIAFLF